jgi:hypothetical protein
VVFERWCSANAVIHLSEARKSWWIAQNRKTVQVAPGVSKVLGPELPQALPYCVTLFISCLAESSETDSHPPFEEGSELILRRT